MAKYKYEELINSNWEERDIIQAKNRKRALKQLEEKGKKLKSGTFKIRKISD